MKNYCGINAGIRGRFMKRLIESMSFKAFAEENEGTDNKKGDEVEEKGKDSTPTLNYEDLISKARKEEKDKQYNKIKKLEGNVETLTGQHNEDLLKIASLEAELEKTKEAPQKNTEPNEGANEVASLKSQLETIKAERDSLTEKVSTLEQTTPVNREDIENEIRASLEEEYELKAYKMEQMNAFKDEILVPELVIGTTKEEIDASIESARERSAKIKESLGVKEKRTPKTASNPSVSGVQDNAINLEKLATMDVRSPEYAEARKKLGLK